MLAKKIHSPKKCHCQECMRRRLKEFISPQQFHAPDCRAYVEFRLGPST